MRVTGKYLNKKWQVGAKHALFRKSGDWFHKLEKFPGAFFDENGYVVFQNEEEFNSCSYLRIQKGVHVRGGISGIPGYIRVRGNDGLLAEHFEGSPYDVTQTRYERDASARSECIEHWGYSCQVCRFNFLESYGEVGEGFIHVHHMKPLSEAGEEYQVNPTEDLRPVCPNCHAMIHRRDPPYSLEEIRQMLKSK